MSASGRAETPSTADTPGPGSRRSRTPSAEQLMALAFAVGSTCFLIGPFPGYLQLVGARADSLTFFVGSLFFTLGGGIQLILALPGRREGGAGRAAFWVAATQFAGTLFFNATTFRGLQTAVSSSSYDRLVWRPDAFGSICFLVSGVIGYGASTRHGWWPVRHGAGWWQPAVNLLGCVFFGISAVAGYVLPSTGSMVALGGANWNTAAGAACFLACAVGALAGPASGGAAPVIPPSG